MEHHADGPAPIDLSRDPLARAAPLALSAGWICSWTGGAGICLSVAWLGMQMHQLRMDGFLSSDDMGGLVSNSIGAVVALVLVFAGWKLRMAARTPDVRLRGALAVGLAAGALNMLSPVFSMIAWWAFWDAPGGVSIVSALGWSASGVLEGLHPAVLAVTGLVVLRRALLAEVDAGGGAATTVGSAEAGWTASAVVVLLSAGVSRGLGVFSMLAQTFGFGGGWGWGYPWEFLCSTCASVPGALLAGLTGFVLWQRTRSGRPVGRSARIPALMAFTLLGLADLVGLVQQIYWTFSYGAGSAAGNVVQVAALMSQLVLPIVTLVIVIRAGREFTDPPASAAAPAAAPPEAPAAPPPA